MTIPKRPERSEWARDAAKALKLTPSTRTVLEYLAFRAGSKGKAYGALSGRFEGGYRGSQGQDVQAHSWHGPKDSHR